MNIDYPGASFTIHLKFIEVIGFLDQGGTTTGATIDLFQATPSSDT
jgi:hypothetical protein